MQRLCGDLFRGCDIIKICLPERGLTGSKMPAKEFSPPIISILYSPPKYNVQMTGVFTHFSGYAIKVLTL
jgi:hypothetical protein